MPIKMWIITEILSYINELTFFVFSFSFKSQSNVICRLYHPPYRVSTSSSKKHQQPLHKKIVIKTPNQIFRIIFHQKHT